MSPPMKNVHLYLLMGQSNMSGCGTVEEEDKTAHPRVLRIDPGGQWIPAAEPLHFDVEARGVGPGFSFAKEMANADESVMVGLIPCAVGGSPLRMWQKGADYYNAAVARAREAMKAGSMKGVLWHQGESDLNDNDAPTYAARFTQMVKDLRADLGVKNLPVVVGTLGDFIVDFSPLTGFLNNALMNVPNEIHNTACALSTGLKNQDAVHFGAEAQRELGRRYAKEMTRLIGATK